MPTTDTFELLSRLGVATALGLLVGLQREHQGGHSAGVRTFTLITVLGCLAAALSATFGPWLVGAGLLGVAGMLIAANLPSARTADQQPPGLTTEIAALVMYTVGAWLAQGPITPAVVVGGAVMLLLQWKRPIHDLAGRMGGEDWRAIAQFVLITLVILPLLPNQGYGPWKVLNPREIWLMVVLIVGIGLGGYVLAKALGQGAGMWLGGILGGIISSTATTVSWARRAKAAEGDASGPAALVVMVASTVAFVRVAALAAAVAPQQAKAMAPPLLALFVALLLITLLLWRGARGGRDASVGHGNPAELKPALVFGGLYAVVILAVAAGNAWFGDSALYLVALIGGSTDLDAVTLSAARLSERGQIGVDVAWRMVVVAALANLVFKWGIAYVLGTRALAGRLAWAFGLSLVAGGLVLWLWP